MDLLERYLHAVKFFLPQAQQDDIIRELSANLTAQMEDRQEELGRPLTEAEQAEILRRHGQPMIVAGRYRKRQQLIGPAFFPLYLFALKAGLGVAALVTTVLAAVTGVLEGNPLDALRHAVGAYPGRALMVFAWTTLGFAVVDLVQTRIRVAYEWDPRQLPRVGKPGERISRYRTLCELILGVVYLAWLLVLPQMPSLVLGPAAGVIEPSSAWRVPYVVMVLMTFATIALNVVDYLRPYWTHPRAVARLALHAVSFVTFAFVFRGSDWFVAGPGVTAWNEVPIERVLEIANACCQIGFLGIAVVSLIDFVRGVYRLSVRRHTPFPGNHSAPVR